MQNKIAYIDFAEQFDGIETNVRIFETKTHLFIYVNQSHSEIHLYNEFLKNILIKQCRQMKNKKIEVICNLEKYDCIDKIAQHIVKILNG